MTKEYTEALGIEGEEWLIQTGEKKEASLEEVLPELNPKERL